MTNKTFLNQMFLFLESR